MASNSASVAASGHIDTVVDAVWFRTPQLEHAPTMYDIVTSGSLDDNSAYAYMLYCTHFADSCIVAEDASSGKTLGFVIGYRPPTHPDAYFCWQVGVTQDARGKRIARRMLEQLCKSQAESHGVKYLEATVTGDNQASQNLFRSIGRRAGCEVAVTKAHFPERVFPKGHLAEDLFRVGPFESDTIGTVVEDKEAARS